MNELVSIIMLSHRKVRFVEESVRSVIAQTYQNWELLFVDDNSKDGTVSLLMGLMDEGSRKQEKWAVERRIHISQTVTERGGVGQSVLFDERGAGQMDRFSGCWGCLDA